MQSAERFLIEARTFISLLLYYLYRKQIGINDFELIINSDSGAVIKKVNTHASDPVDIEFIDTDIRTFFQESILIDIILHNNAIYLNKLGKILIQ